jgi:hypothetical protein
MQILARERTVVRRSLAQKPEDRPDTMNSAKQVRLLAGAPRGRRFERRI